MRFARLALTLVTVAALAAYGSDCLVTSTPGEAMQCCHRMPCSSHGHHHGQDCCKTMPSMHAPFVKADPAHGAQASLEFFAMLPVLSNSAGLDSLPHAILTANSHAPPILQPAVLSPLRI
jgi:hypothetical protein